MKSVMYLNLPGTVTMSSSAIRRPSFVRIKTKCLSCITRPPSSLTTEHIDKRMLV